MSTGEVRTLRFASGGIHVGAHVRLPAASAPPYPGVALAHGSGPCTRHDHAAFEAPFLAAGLAVLSHDKPGCGDTGGSYTDQGLDDRIAESAAALAALRAQPEVDGRRVGLWGGSQGGWVVPGVAAAEPVAFAIVCSAAGVTPFEQEAFSLEQRLRDDCAGTEAIAAAVAYYHHRAAALRGNPDVTLEVVPGADHGLRPPDASAPGGRARADGLLEGMAAWAAARVRPG